jgi:hypothetical protein
VGPGDGAHAISRWLIVEQNPAAAVHLQIDEARGQERAGREALLRPIGRNLAPGPQSGDSPVPDQHRRFGTPASAVKNAVREDSMPLGG